MRQNSLLTILFLTFVSLSVSANDTNLKVTKLILNSSVVMSATEAKIKAILPTLKMEFTGIMIETTASEYSAIVSYKDTAKDTFFHPSFGRCSLLVKGRVSQNSVTVSSISEDDCGE